MNKSVSSVDPCGSNLSRFPMSMLPQGNLALALNGPHLEYRPGTVFKGCVLVIDNERHVLDHMRRLLGSYGVRVAGFTNPYDAVHWYEDHWNKVSLVFLGMKNPHMDGEYCFALLQSINSDVRIAVMSGEADTKMTDELMDEGALHIFKKPFNFTDMIGWAMQTGINSAA